MFKKIKIIIFSIAICMLTVFLVIHSGIFGVPADIIEQAARKRQKIDNTWDAARSVNEKLGTMIFSTILGMITLIRYMLTGAAFP